MIWVLRLVYPRFGFPKWILALGSPRVCLVIGLGHLGNQVSILVLGLVLYLGKLFIHLGELFIHLVYGCLVLVLHLSKLFIHLGESFIHLGELFIHGSYQGFKAGLRGWTRLRCRLLVFGS